MSIAECSDCCVDGGGTSCVGMTALVGGGRVEGCLFDGVLLVMSSNKQLETVSMWAEFILRYW